MHNSSKSSTARKRVVLLVDNKRRDLMGAALIAWHLEQLGLECILEPLEAWRGALAAHRPNLIIFNHVNAGHLIAYTKRLARMGVATAVLPNEGILYDPEVLIFNAGKYHNGSHIDVFFCWNEPHRQALRKVGFQPDMRIEVVGVPRFDYYFEPWSRVFSTPRRASGKPSILVCTNFGFAKFFEVPKETARHYLDCYKDIANYRDYWSLVETNHRAQAQSLTFLDALVAAHKFAITLRPHPNENLAVYRRWLAALPPESAASVTIDQETNITQLILNCDLEVSCETCTTPMESWLARKPTVELVLQKHPVFFHPEIAKMNVTCEKPADLPSIIEHELAHPDQAAKQAMRTAHLQKWCDAPSGRASAKIAEAVAQFLQARPAPDWSQLGLADRRRAAKLNLLRKFNLPYHFDPMLAAKSRLLGGKHRIRAFAFRKSIRPADVRQARRMIELGMKRTAPLERSGSAPSTPVR